MKSEFSKIVILGLFRQSQQRSRLFLIFPISGSYEEDIHINGDIKGYAN